VNEIKTLNLRRKLLLFGAPVVLVGAGLTTMAANAATPTPTATASPQVEKPGTAAIAAAPAEAAEPADTAAEIAAEAKEAALPGRGHADNATTANADHQFDGVE
jgi:hypothetical protein